VRPFSFLVLCGTIFLVALSQAPSQTPPTVPFAAFDPGQLVGEWEGYLVDGDGSKPSQRSGNVTLSITVDTISTRIQGSQGQGTYHLSPGDGNSI
jgi:hypothetical protein